MKKFLLMAVVAVFAISASAQTAHWNALSVPQTPEEADAIGWQVVSDDYPVTPEDYTLCEGDGFRAFFEKTTLIGNKCSYAKSYYTRVPFMGMNNSERNGIQSLYFIEGLENNDYVRTNSYTNDGTVIQNGQSGTYTDAIVTITNDTYYGEVTIAYSRGDNLSAMYVVDSSINSGEGMMVLQNQTRCQAPDGESAGNKTHVAKFGVVPGHTYYIIASEKQSVELYDIAFKAITDDSYEEFISADDYPVYWDASSVPQTPEEADAAGWQVAFDDYPISPENYTLCEGDGFRAYFEKATLIGNKCNYAKDKYTRVPWMGMNNSVRDGIQSLYFIEGLENNDYVRTNSYTNDGYTIQSGQSGTYTDAIVTITNETCYGKVAINYSRGDNLSAMYVVDSSINSGEGMMVLQSQTRCQTPDGESAGNKAHTAEFSVVPNHTYYIMASDKQSVELYSLGFCPVTNDLYENGVPTPDPTGIQNVTTSTKATPNDGKIYSIDGRYVGTETGSLSKGVYIMNGQKFIVK